MGVSEPAQSKIGVSLSGGGVIFLFLWCCCDRKGLYTFDYHIVMVYNKMTNTINRRKLEALMNLKIPEREAKILIVLDKYSDGLKQKDIMQYGYMYQPEVSLGLKSLIKRKWVCISENVPAEIRGRPYGVYTLVKTSEEIIAEIEKDIVKEHERIMSGIERLKTMI